MSYKPLDVFTDRDSEIGKFEQLLREEDRWVMLVDGLSGTGKTLLVDWLRRNRCSQIPSSKITLYLNTNILDLFELIALQLHEDIGAQYREDLRKLNEQEQQQSLVQYTAHMNITSSQKSSIDGASQETVLEMGSLGEIVRLEKEMKRMDVFLNALGGLRNQTWILFIDEASNLSNPYLARVILEQLFPRLHNRFPGFRTYLTGQSVPRDMFSKHERLEASLDTFSPAVSADFLKKVGVDQPGIQQQAYRITLGHPLMIGMLAEDLVEQDLNEVSQDLAGIESNLDERERTEWITTRIIDKISDPAVREVASNLVIFEWFDLDLLKKVFDVPLSEKVFQELVMRSFIKPLEGGKWKCHDILIKHLRPHRQRMAPQQVVQLHRRNFEVLQERISQSEETEGRWDFRDRIMLFGAGLDSLAFCSVQEAQDVLLDEIARGIVELAREYLHSLVRYIENNPGLQQFNSVASQTRACLEGLSLLELSSEDVDWLDSLATHSAQREQNEVADVLLYIAAIFANALDKPEQALSFSERALALNPSPENYRQVAEAYVDLERYEEAATTISEGEAQCSDCVELRLARVTLALAQEGPEKAISLLVETLAEFPDSESARLQLARLFYQMDHLEQALEQTELIIKNNANNADAQSLRITLLGEMDRGADIISLTHSADLPLSDLANDTLLLMQTLADPVQKGGLLAEIFADPKAYPATLITGLISPLAVQGDIENVQRLLGLVKEHWPEMLPVARTGYGYVLVQTGKPQEAIPLFEDILNSGRGVLDTYIGMCIALGLLNRRAEQREFAAKLIQSFPAARDLAQGFMLRSYAEVGELKQAIGCAKTLEKEYKLGPIARSALAQIYVMAGDIATALAIYDELISTMERSDAPVNVIFGIYGAYAQLLATRGNVSKAKELAATLMEMRFHRALAVTQAANIYMTIQDEEGLRAALQARDDWSDFEIGALYGGLSQLVLARLPNLESLYAEFKAHPERIEVFMAMDGLLTVTGQLDLAPQMLNFVQEVSPGLIERYAEIQSKYMRAVPEQVVAQLRQQMDQNPGNIAMLLGLGRILIAKGLYEDANREFNKLIELAPHLKDYAIGQQTIPLIRTGLIEQAGVLLKPYLEAETPPLELLEAIDEYLDASGDLQANLTFQYKIVSTYPEMRARIYDKIGRLLYFNDCFDDILDFLEALEEAGETISADLQYMKAYALQKLKRPADSLLLADRLLEEKETPGNLLDLLWEIKAELYLEQGNQQQALDAYYQAIDCDPKVARYYFKIAELCREQGNAQEAYDALISGLALEPAAFPEYEAELQQMAKARRAQPPAPS